MLQATKSFVAVPQALKCTNEFSEPVSVKATTLALARRMNISNMLFQLDSWCVILNGSVEIIVDGDEPLTLHLGDSFGVEPTLKKMRHRGVMKTRVDDCQVRDDKEDLSIVP